MTATAALDLRLILARCAHTTHGRHVLCNGVLLEAAGQVVTIRALRSRAEFTLQPGAILKQCWRCHGWNAVILH